MLAACGGGSGSDVVCGAPDELFDIAIESDLDELANCTTIAGSLRFGDTQFAAIDGLESLRVIEGTLNLFRNPSLVDLGGLANLERVGGELLVHFNDSLASPQLTRVRECGELFVASNASITELGLDALATVSGDLSILANPVLSQADAEAFAAQLEVGGAIDVSGNAPP